MNIALRRARPASAGLWLALGLCSACSALEEELDTYERTLVAQLRIGEPPPSPSNAVADHPAAVELGHRLFFDPRMSGPLGPDNDLVTRGRLGPSGATDKVACVACHDLKNGGADRRSEPAASSLGVAWTSRNTPTVLNAAYSPTWHFWDGRADSLWSQAIAALEAPATHGGNRLAIAHLVFAEYRSEYEQLFGALPDGLADTSTTSRFPPAGKPGSPAWDAMAPEDQEVVNRIFSNVGKVLEAYERKLVCRDSPFDRWLDGDEAAMSPEAIRGLRLFIGRAACLECHSGPTFTNYSFHNTGTPQYGEHAARLDDGRRSGIDRLKASVFNRAGPFSDLREEGHMAGLVATDDDAGRFLTPSLRCVAQTAPYKHNGVYATLRDVITHYDEGGSTGLFAGARDVRVRPLHLTDDERSDLVAFLEALTGAPLPDTLTSAP
ncbi:cytochrome-c peroxidase [Myxococcota bacterium]|nr:cytochrome-c peroxidase [Myxococcota bacterium]